jgi:hypothetical protein
LQAKKLPTLLTRCVILLLETIGHCEGLFAQFKAFSIYRQQLPAIFDLRITGITGNEAP